MKFKILTLLLVLSAFSFSAYATNPISPEAFDFEKSFKVEKKMNKATTLVAKFSKTKVGKWVTTKAIKWASQVNLSDPVEKWIWYAVLGVLAGTAVWIIAAIIPGLWPLSYLGSLLWLVGVICFWYWVYLKFLQ